jgi:hypothetical protein
MQQIATSCTHTDRKAAPFTTPQQISLLKQALGVELCTKSHRNELLAEVGSAEYRDCRVLVELKLMLGGFVTHSPTVERFKASEAGRALILGPQA